MGIHHRTIHDVDQGNLVHLEQVRRSREQRPKPEIRRLRLDLVEIDGRPLVLMPYPLPGATIGHVGTRRIAGLMAESIHADFIHPEAAWEISANEKYHLPDFIGRYVFFFRHPDDPASPYAIVLKAGSVSSVYELHDCRTNEEWPVNGLMAFRMK